MSLKEEVKEKRAKRKLNNKNIDYVDQVWDGKVLHNDFDKRKRGGFSSPASEFDNKKLGSLRGERVPNISDFDFQRVPSQFQSKRPLDDVWNLRYPRTDFNYEADVNNFQPYRFEEMYTAPKKPITENRLTAENTRGYSSNIFRSGELSDYAARINNDKWPNEKIHNNLNGFYKPKIRNYDISADLSYADKIGNTAYNDKRFNGFIADEYKSYPDTTAKGGSLRPQVWHGDSFYDDSYPAGSWQSVQKFAHSTPIQQRAALQSAADYKELARYLDDIESYNAMQKYQDSARPYLKPASNTKLAPMGKNQQFIPDKPWYTKTKGVMKNILPATAGLTAAYATLAPSLAEANGIAVNPIPATVAALGLPVLSGIEMGANGMMGLEALMDAYRNMQQYSPEDAPDMMENPYEYMD